MLYINYAVSILEQFWTKNQFQLFVFSNIIYTFVLLFYSTIISNTV